MREEEQVSQKIKVKRGMINKTLFTFFCNGERIGNMHDVDLRMFFGPEVATALRDGLGQHQSPDYIEVEIEAKVVKA
jgi:hypothetical protein